jgi:hypothetical protein
MDNDIRLFLTDASNLLVDEVIFGDPPGRCCEAPNLDASSISDESVARVPDGADTGAGSDKFRHNPASIGAANPSPTFLGDYNQNHTVDAADYVVWRRTLGKIGPGFGADGNGDNFVDPPDYDVWRAYFGKTVGSGPAFGSSSDGVPEPASAPLLILGAVLGRWRVRRKQIRGKDVCLLPTRVGRCAGEH